MQYPNKLYEGVTLLSSEDYLLERRFEYEYVDADTIDIYVVWLSKTLQNNKALLSTDKDDGRYYEITYNGDKDEFYVDMYKKELNRAVTIKKPKVEGN